MQKQPPEVQKQSPEVVFKLKMWNISQTSQEGTCIGVFFK